MNTEAVKLAHLLLEGDADASFAFLCDLREQGWPSVDIYQRIVSGAMQHIGELWEQDHISVADEHLATATCDFMISRYHAQTKQKKLGHKAMFLCVAEEQHTLGMRMASLLFEENGWKTKMMGANLPLEHAVSAAQKWQPDVICLSVTILYHVPVLKMYAETLESLPFHPKIMVGSRLLSMYDLSPYCTPNTLFMTDYKKLIGWMNDQSEGKASGAS
ncbi:cobalamin B12-binding domain-containing protein [Domibacillus robiginosus]|uniref:cobalamin B12-binding domain-containing protein n=1 Tax=Domibacillus robiginosus TaxID=1071054 RepID=UPI00067D685C|nr:cobalamin-dependent protein [Domibacillus robiginosus]